MLSPRTAAALLAAADSPHAIATLLASVGIDGVARPLDAGRRSAIGLTESFRDLTFIPVGNGGCALAGVIGAGPPLREQLPRIAARLQSHAPHLLCLVALADNRDASLALAAWSGDRRPPRVRSLLVDRRQVRVSDAETICALQSGANTDAGLQHLRWTEVLGRDALCRRFYRELERRVTDLATSAPGRCPPDDRRTLALLYTSRLLFLAFLEAKGWLDGRRTYLIESFDACAAAGGRFHARVLRPLFFGTLNTPLARRAPTARALGRIPFLNGGLFAPTPVERRNRDLVFADRALGAIVGDLFSRYRFTAREDSTTWSDAAVDPEMLGRAFESLMASHDRRDSGAFFTPQRLVERVTDQALEQLLVATGLSESDAARLLVEGAPPVADHEEFRRRLARATLLDPACGSGAFLVHALHRLADLRIVLGDRRPVSAVRRDVLTASLFGVDRNPTAVWLCELRLWLAVVIECDVADPLAVAPLPNLDRNVRVGDSLSGPGFGAADGPHAAGSSKLALLHRRYARATGARKSTLGRTLDRRERSRALSLLERELTAARHARREAVLAHRGRDLFGERHRLTAADRRDLTSLRRRVVVLQREHRRLADGGALPFSFPVHFADIGDRGGFDVVIGNPPWVRLHRIPARERARLQADYFVFRRAQWEPGAAAAHASAGFAGQVDLAALFVERSVALLANGGTLALLLPAKLWRSLAGGGVRRLVDEHARVVRVEDYSDAPALFDAAVYPSLLVARKPPAIGDAVRQPIAIAVHRHGTREAWHLPPSGLTLDDTAGSPWLLLPPAVRAAFDRLTRIGVPLADGPVGRPLLGVKSGCNDAFVVELLDARGGVATVRAAGGKTGELECRHLRPVVRGETLRPWVSTGDRERIVWPCDERGVALRELPPRTRRWLSRYRHRLAARTDAHGKCPWWTLFRTDGARSDVPRVVWADFGRRPRALVLPAGDPTVPMNTCYVIRCADADDARTLAAILNSPVAAAWSHVLAEPARGGFRRYLGWTMARLPLPADWDRARRTLAPLVTRFEGHDPPVPIPDAQLLESVLEAFGIDRRQLAPLLRWSTR